MHHFKPNQAPALMQCALEAIKNKAKNRQNAGFFIGEMLLNQELLALYGKYFPIEKYLKTLCSKRKQLLFLMPWTPQGIAF